MERISRREFIKVCSVTGLAAFMPDFSNIASKEAEPLSDLPVLITNETPLLVSYPKAGSNASIYEKYGQVSQPPEWLKATGVALDLMPPFLPEPDLSVPDGPYMIPWTGVLPHITHGRPSLVKAVVGWGDLKRINILNGTLISPGRDYVSSFAFSDRLSIYPSKIYNNLSALALIARWHQENGPFVPGTSYSYLKITQVTDRVFDDYIFGQAYYAGGICASVSTISKCIFLASAQAKAEYLERYLHIAPYQYSENPYDRSITKSNSDASVEFEIGRPAEYPGNVDLKFRLLPDCEPLYFSLNADLVMDQTPTKEGSYFVRHGNPPADARLTFSVSLVREDPNKSGNQYANLIALRDAYSAFHNFDNLFALNRWEKNQRDWPTSPGTT